MKAELRTTPLRTPLLKGVGEKEVPTEEKKMKASSASAGPLRELKTAFPEAGRGQQCQVQWMVSNRKSHYYEGP